jgi:hypothetical protein
VLVTTRPGDRRNHRTATMSPTVPARPLAYHSTLRAGCAELIGGTPYFSIAWTAEPPAPVGAG